MRLLLLLLMYICIQASLAELLKKEPTYVVVAPTKIRPDQWITVAANVLKLEYDSFTITAVVRKLNEEICSSKHTFTREGSHNLKMKTLPDMSNGNYTIRVSGFSDPEQKGQIFTNVTELFFDDRQVAVFIQISKPMYKQGQTVRWRVIPVQTNLLPVSTTMDIRIREPNGFVVREFFAQHTNAGGVVSLSYKLNDNLLAYGKWQLEVTCLGRVYNKTFRVQQFYGTLFYVNMSMPLYMLRNSYGLSGIVASNHTTGRGAKGNATVKLEIRSMEDSSSAAIPQIIRLFPYFDGRIDFLFTREEMETVAGGSRSLIGKELRVTGYVKDWLLDQTGSAFQVAMVYSEDVQLKFLGGHVWTFKPELPLKLYIAAQRRDGSPLDPFNKNRTINLVITETTTTKAGISREDTVQIPPESVAEYIITPKPTTERIHIVAKYRNKEDTRSEFVATKFWSPNNYYIQLTTSAKRPTVGEYMIFNVRTNTFVEKVYYHIVAAGSILLSDTLPMYTSYKLFSIALSRDMAPSARIIAYFIAPDGQVITDSINFHVNGTRLHEMSIRFNRGKDFSYKSVEITATADPLAYVAFSAIEYQLFRLGARNGLSWEEVYQELYTFDNHANTSIRHYFQENGQMSNSFYAPTPTFAHDANSTFFYAGLYIYTDANASAVYTACNKTKGEFSCGDGKTCYNHREYCTSLAECTYDYKDEMGCSQNDTYNLKIYDDNRLWRVKHGGSFYKDGGFMWKDQFTKPDGRVDIKIKTSNFPSTWVVSGFAMSKENGLAILPEPGRFDGVRPMYITVQGPKRINEGEHMSLRVAIFNFWDEQMDVLVTVKASDDYQFVNWDRESGSSDGAFPVNGEHQVLVPVFPGDNRQIYIPIVPRRRGPVVIPITALCFVGGETVTFRVFVDKYGVPETYLTSYQVDLRKGNSETLPDLRINVAERALTAEQRLFNHVPGSPRTTINIIGDIVGLSFFSYAKFDLNAQNLLRQPYGTGSEAIFNYAINLYTLKMLKSMSTVSQKKVDRVTYTLNIAMQDMFSYGKPDGSFKEFRWETQSSVWLTALALQTLAEGRYETKDIEKDFQVPAMAVNKAATWLASKQDNSTGRFVEITPLYNRRMASKTMYTDPVTKKVMDANVALTSFCLIALGNAQDLTDTARAEVDQAMRKAATYLNSLGDSVNDPFELAISTHALFAQNQKNRMSSLQRLKKMSRGGASFTYWSDTEIPPMRPTGGKDNQLTLNYKPFSNSTSYAVAATSYALLSYLDNSEDFEETDKIQKFLQEQHMHVGGFASTQDSLIAIHALSRLAQQNQDRTAYEMSFLIKSDQSKTWRQAITIDQDNWFDLHTIETPSHWGNIQIEARGHGVALVQLSTSVHYEHTHLLRQPPTPGIFSLGNFNRDITTSGFNHSVIHYNLCPSWGGETNQSGMVVLEVSIPSGYVVANNSLQAFVRSQVKLGYTLRNAEFSFRLGKAIFYFEYIDKTRDNCAKFEASRYFPVANVTEQQGIRVYEYYEPGNFLYTFYEKIELTKLTVCLVCGSYQCPFCPYYASANYHLPSLVIVTIAAFIAIVTKQWLFLN